jgi:hypothetical protein
MKKIDIAGQKFHRLTAIKFIKTRGINAYWQFRCDCGTLKVLFIGRVKNGGIKSCGCLLKEVREKRDFGRSGSISFPPVSSRDINELKNIK